MKARIKNKIVKTFDYDGSLLMTEETFQAQVMYRWFPFWINKGREYRYIKNAMDAITKATKKKKRIYKYIDIVK